MNELEKMFCKACVVYGVYKITGFAIEFEKAFVKGIKNKVSERKQKDEGAC